MTRTDRMKRRRLARLNREIGRLGGELDTLRYMHERLERELERRARTRRGTSRG